MTPDPDSDIDYTIWTDIAQQLVAQYSKYYFNSEYYESDNPLEDLTVLPGITLFFGTKVFNILIVGDPIGWKMGDDGTWSETWPPTGYNDALTQHMATFGVFTSYQTLIWTDFIIVQKIEALQPDSKIRDMMNQVEVRLKAMCTTLASFGFQYMGRFNDPPDISVFTALLDPFYSVPPAL